MKTKSLKAESPKQKYFQSSPTVEDLTNRNVETIARLEEAARIPDDNSQRFADKVTALCGSFFMVWFHVLWFGGWIALNFALPEGRRFDPFPFSFLTLMVSLEAIFLSTFIMVTQKRQGAINERRAHLDLQVNLLSEQENTKMLELLCKMAAHLGVDTSADQTLSALQETTSPEKLLKQIEQSDAKAEAPKQAV